MRAVVYGGGGNRVVGLPAWVKVDVPDRHSGGVALPVVFCARCTKVVELPGPRERDERELGRFILWHQLCQDPALMRRPAAQVAAAPSDEWLRAFERGSEDDGT